MSTRYEIVELVLEFIDGPSYMLSLVEISAIKSENRLPISIYRSWEILLFRRMYSVVEINL